MTEVTEERNHRHCEFSVVTDWGHAEVLVAPLPWDALWGLSSCTVAPTFLSLLNTIRGVILEIALAGPNEIRVKMFTRLQ